MTTQDYPSWGEAVTAIIVMHTHTFIVLAAAFLIGLKYARAAFNGVL
jgi:hypothetical protein